MVKQLPPRLGFGWTVRILTFVMLGTLALTLALFRPRQHLRRDEPAPLVDLSAFRETTYCLFCGGIPFSICIGFLSSGVQALFPAVLSCLTADVKMKARMGMSPLQN